MQSEIVVEVTGYCILLDPDLIDMGITTFLENDCDVVTNVRKLSFPMGMGIQIFPLSALEEVARTVSDPVVREHVSLYIYEHPERFSLHNVESGLAEKYWNLRHTVDTQEDFELIRAIFEELYPKNPAFSLHDVLDLLNLNPELIEINRHIQ
jgi:spore coat polysaccharide biosynthesis protein SpsF